MKRNFLFVLLTVIVIAAFVAVAPVFAQGAEPPVPNTPVELPIELQALLAAGIGFLVTAGLKSLSTLLKKDISGWASVITGGLTTSVIFFFNALLSTVPEAAQPSVTVALTLLVTILSAFGIARTVKGFQPAQVK